MNTKKPFTKNPFLSNALKFFFFLVFGIFSPIAQINAQEPVVSPLAKGPTLIIASNLTSNYDSSRLVNSRTSTIWIVGGGKDKAPGGTEYYWDYLDAAINQALSMNYQNIIILEGSYFVNGPIIIDKVGTNTGRISIEGEGFGTRIFNAATYNTGNIFEVRSNFNTIKNLSIISKINEDKDINGVIKFNTHTCLAITTLYSTVAPKHNIFENLYMGVSAMVSTVGSILPGRKGISINSSAKEVGFNRFKNIIFNGFEKGIELQGSLRLHNNHFENLSFNNPVIGVDFITGTKAEDNVFENLVIQTRNYSINLVKNITGRHNTFSSLNHSDWIGINGNTAGISFITIAAGAEHTIIQNSEIGNQGWRASNPDTNTIPNPAYLTNNGKYTQLINNFGGNSDVTYKFGNQKNTANVAAVSFTEILGQMKIAGDNATNTPTAAPGRTLITDANGFAVWSDILSATATTWDQNVTKNISLGGWALTQSSNTTTNGVVGLRMDNNGSVRIGGLAPDPNDGMLQVDGNFVSKYLKSNGSYEPQFTARNGKVFIGNANNALFTGASATTELAFKMYVNGKIRVKDEFYIKNQGITWPDYVFEEKYPLMPLNELKNHIQKEGHLPNMPKAKWIEEQGIPVAEIVSKQQEKIEELSLYLIAIKKELDTLKQEN